MKTSLLGILSGVALTTPAMVISVSNPASAVQLWNWSYSGGGSLGGSGTFTTNDGPNPYLITDITGTSEGSSIIGLFPVNGYAGNDNQLTSDGSLNINGVSFFTAIASINLFQDGANTRICVGQADCFALPPSEYPVVEFKANLQAKTTPEPSSLLGYIALSGLMLGSAVKKVRT